MDSRVASTKASASRTTPRISATAALDDQRDLGAAARAYVDLLALQVVVIGAGRPEAVVLAVARE